MYLEARGQDDTLVYINPLRVYSVQVDATQVSVFLSDGASPDYVLPRKTNEGLATTLFRLARITEAAASGTLDSILDAAKGPAAARRG